MYIRSRSILPEIQEKICMQLVFLQAFNRATSKINQGISDNSEFFHQYRKMNHVLREEDFGAFSFSDKYYLCRIKFNHDYLWQRQN